MGANLQQLSLPGKEKNVEVKTAGGGIRIGRKNKKEMRVSDMTHKHKILTFSPAKYGMISFDTV